MNLAALGIKALAGGLTGYATNTFAIKMLFEKVGPLGGVILETRKEFTENTSQLVERDIINHRTIEKELKKKEFRTVFIQIIEDILNEYLAANTEDTALAKLPAMEQSLSNFFTFYEEEQEEFIAKLLKSITPHLALEDLIGAEQLEHLAERFIHFALEVVKENNIIEELLTALYYENQEQQLNDFIPQSVFEELAKNFEVATEDFHLNLKEDFEAEIDSTIDRLYRELEIKDILKQVEGSLKKKSLAELLGKESTAQLANQFLERVLKFLQSAEGRELIVSFLEEVVDLLKGIELSILELLSTDLRQNLESFMENKLPGIIEDIISWIKSNQLQIEDLIDEAVKEALSGESPQLLDWLRQKGKKILYEVVYSGNLAKKEGLVAKIIQGIREETDIQLLSKEVTEQLVAYISTKEIGEIVSDLEAKGLLKVTELSKVLMRNLARYLKEADLSVFDNLFTVAVGQIIELDLLEHFEEQLKEFLVDKFKNDFLFTANTTDILQQKIRTKVLSVGKYSWAELIDEESLNNYTEFAQQRSWRVLKEERARLVAKTTEFSKDLLTKKKLAELINRDIEASLINSLGEVSTYHLQKYLNKAEQKEISSFYFWLSSQENLPQNLTEIMLELINRNLGTIIEGRIEEVVADNLSKLPDAELQKMVENFMGQELQPITLFGAGLGTVAAVLVELGQSYLGLNHSLSLPLSLFTYGLVGYLTNVIALKMIFKPYSAKRLLGVQIPFTPGVVSKQKPRFAKSMSCFVEEKLLNKEAVEEIFKTKRQLITSNLTETLANDDYQLIVDFLNANSDFISQEILKLLLRLVESNQQYLVENLTVQLSKYDLTELDFKFWESKVSKQLHTSLSGLEAVLIDKLESLLNSSASLKSILPDLVLEAFAEEMEQQIVEKIAELLNLLNDKQGLKKLIGSWEEHFDIIMEQSLEQLISAKQKQAFKIGIKDYLFEQLNSTEARQRILDLVENKLFKQVNPEQKLGDLFDGVLMESLTQESDYLIKAILAKGEGYLAENRAEIKRLIVQEAKQELAKEKSSGLGGFLKGTFKELTFKGLDVYSSMQEVVDIFIDTKLPGFVEDKERELIAIFNKSLNNFAETRLKELGLDLNQEGIREIVDRLVIEPKLIHNLEILVDRVLDSVFKVKLKSLLEIVSVDSIFAVLAIFSQELELLQYELANNLVQKESLVKKDISNLLKNIFEKELLSLPLAQLTRGISSQELSQLVKQFLAAPAFNDSLELLVSQLLNKLKEQKIDSLVNLDYFKSDLQQTIDTLLRTQQFREDLRMNLEQLITIIIKNINDILELETKEFVLDILINSSLDGVENNFLSLMNSVNIREVTEEQISNMDPSEIEELFNSFAKKYFRKLELYGWMGSLVGLVAESAMLLF
ncbi:DUF445 family protein [Fuchsiella alkaliacetigena]|uniref:DUF445 family protein n=1 Tax=Fuchsiella alkaliacetigena TaxID=957042 RepID=UPI00200AB8D9|nr:DUF445 family protein [Fuchsiella alkaliacetigena]MCK8823976.1 DUF445 family protein [Fuchsiella alkaliacetigena]